jgi:hypothetical protein
VASSPGRASRSPSPAALPARDKFEVDHVLDAVSVSVLPIAVREAGRDRPEIHEACTVPGATSPSSAGRHIAGKARS